MTNFHDSLEQRSDRLKHLAMTTLITNDDGLHAPGIRVLEEALAEVRIAMTARIDAALEEGKAVPPPRYRPAIYQSA